MAACEKVVSHEIKEQLIEKKKARAAGNRA
jgi:hypothetical protein